MGVSLYADGTKTGDQEKSFLKERWWELQKHVREEVISEMMFFSVQ